MVGYGPGAQATDAAPWICLVLIRRRPPAPNTYRGSAAAGRGGATAFGRCVLETFVCPHAVPCKRVISSVKRKPAFPRVSYLRARGRGRRGWSSCCSRFLVDGARASVQSSARLSSIWPWIRVVIEVTSPFENSGSRSAPLSRLELGGRLTRSALQTFGNRTSSGFNRGVSRGLTRWATARPVRSRAR